MRLFHFARRAAEPGHVFLRTLADAVDPQCLAGRAGHPHSIHAGKRAAIRHPEIAGATFQDLKFDRGRPNLLLASDVIENAAVARLTIARRISRLSPFEFRSQIVVRILLLGDDVAHVLSGNMDDTVLYLEDMIGIVVQSLVFNEGVEGGEIVAIEQDNGLPVFRNFAACCDSARGGG
jgi:hypothetical protein